MNDREAVRLVALEEERNALLRELLARTPTHDPQVEQLIELEKERIALLRELLVQLPNVESVGHLKSLAIDLTEPVRDGTLPRSDARG